LQVLDAFNLLWKDHVDVNLAIVGREGWTDLSDEMRRNIPETMGQIRAHAELSNRLFWFDGISDEYLEMVYAASTCLVAASYGEGFGLPLIEAARHGLPIIARDIPVFREVAGEYAFYVDATTGHGLAHAITAWLKLYREGAHPASEGIRWLTWEQSAARLAERLLPTAAEESRTHAW
jgi:glycosyltransferase involved in cell wall biosynthesis